MAAAKDILASYSPEDVIVVIAGSGFSHIISGTAEGTFISVTRIIPHATLYNGADASNARVVRAVKNADVTITLHSASESNDVLSQLLANDEASRDGSDVFSITIKDNSGRTVMSAPSAFIGTTPDTDFGIEITERPWVIHAINLTQTIGGNGPLSGDSSEALGGTGATVDDRWQPSA